MPDIDTLVAKIRALPARRIAEVEDFVDFLALRRAGKNGNAPRPMELEEALWAIENANRKRAGRPPLDSGFGVRR
jgi:hypothetical protein